MYGYILVAIGLYLIGEDLVKERRAKNEKLLENGNGGGSGDNNRKSSTSGQKPNRDGRIKPFPVETKGGTDELHKKPIHESGTDKAGGSAGDHSSSKPHPAPSDNQAESVTKQTSDVRGPTSEIKGGNDGSEINSENVISDDGGNVDVKPISLDEPDSTKAD